MTTLEVVVPVRDMADRIAECVRLLVTQLAPGDRVTVVDDASTDASGAPAAGAAVLRCDTPAGPYAARQFAAGRSDADALLFVDGRSRARPGLLAAHRALLDRPGVALSCTGVHITPGTTFASRVSAQSGFFAVAPKIGRPDRPDFFPTCNLGVRRAAFLGVGGFRAMRSGGDADLCWRIQLAGWGGLAADPAVLMDWVARERLRSLVEQSVRYGRSSAWLDRLHANELAARAADGSDPAPTGTSTGTSASSSPSTAGPAGPAAARPVAARPAAARRGASAVVGYVGAVARRTASEPALVGHRATGRGLALLQEASRRWARGQAASFVVPEALPLPRGPQEVSGARPGRG